MFGHWCKLSTVSFLQLPIKMIGTTTTTILLAIQAMQTAAFSGVECQGAASATPIGDTHTRCLELTEVGAQLAAAPPGKKRPV